MLDAHLRIFIPPLVAAYLEAIPGLRQNETRRGFLPWSYAICYLLNLFCKVRGEKVIKSFLNNEPRYLEPVLQELETLTSSTSGSDDATSGTSCHTWVERYILLLWVSHLMLTPFPLDIMSSVQSSAETSGRIGIKLPPEVPSASLRILTVCVAHLQSASKERNASAQLLVKMCIRPDMQRLGLMRSLVQWSTSFFASPKEKLEIHSYLGVLSFLAGLAQSSTSEEIGPFLSDIYATCRSVLDRDNLAFVRLSAVARKINIKLIRYIIVHCLQEAFTEAQLDSTTVVEEVVEFLLGALADIDTPVRIAASKALSIIILKLDSEFGAEVIEAILDAFTENVYWQGSERSLNRVNPLKWHGLTLTLAQLLYRKAIPANSLPKVLDALLLSLSFEQQSPTGGSIGTNVRDAACFGVWALSRRYSTEHLTSIKMHSIQTPERWGVVSVPQLLATELVVAACLDPAGNIRRGSSAALQELVGRHPNTIIEGITLVQVVDYQAVGLRHRAMFEVSSGVARLGLAYWDALFEALLGWRACGALDAESRLSAAQAIGALSSWKSPEDVHQMSAQICQTVSHLRSREIEERQGLVSSLAALISAAISDDGITVATARQNMIGELWTFLRSTLSLEEKSFTSSVLRPGFTASSMCTFIGAMATATISLKRDNWPSIPVTELTRIVEFCMQRPEETVHTALASTIPVILQLLAEIDLSTAIAWVSSWLEQLENEASYDGLRCSGHAISLGAAYHALDKYHAEGNWESSQKRILDVLCFRSGPNVAIAARTIALKSLGIMIGYNRTVTASSYTLLELETHNPLFEALKTALNDYTITERGDVGVLVRLEALQTTSILWEFTDSSENTQANKQVIYNSVLRLSLEKVDKVRAKAAGLIEQRRLQASVQHQYTLTDNVSTYEYFAQALEILRASNTTELSLEICSGFVTSAGFGSESVVQNARAALLDFLETLPIDASENSSHISLAQFVTVLVDLTRANLDNDRLLLPLLEVQAFMLDMQIMKRLESTSFK